MHSVVAGGDVSQSTVINARVKKGSPAALAIACVVLLLSAASGTIAFRTAPGSGPKTSSSPASQPARHPDPTSTASAATSATAAPDPTGANGTLTADGIYGSQDLHRAAIFTETNSTGDSVEQAIWFASPLALSKIPAVAAAAQTACSDTPVTNPPERDLVVPFVVVSGLNSTVAVQATVSVSVGDFLDESSNDGGLAQTGLGTVAALGNFQNGIGCDQSGFDSGGTVSLSSKGKFDVFVGWLIFPNAITANDPHGNITALGQTYLQLAVGQGSTTEIDKINATGSGVCVGEPVNNGFISNIDIGTPPYIHIGGPVYPWEGCSGRLTGSPSS